MSSVLPARVLNKATCQTPEVFKEVERFIIHRKTAQNTKRFPPARDFCSLARGGIHSTRFQIVLVQLMRRA